MNKYYLFPYYPLRRVINYMPDDLLLDSQGNIYIVNRLFEPIQIIKSVLNKEFTIEGCNQIQFNKLFVPLTKKKIEEYYIELEDGL